MAGSTSPKSMVLNLILLALLLGGGAAIAWRLAQPSSDPILQGLSGSPREAMETYLGVADDFYFGRASLWDIQKVLTSEDYRWFQDNATSIFTAMDPLNIAGAINPTDAAAASRTMVMRHLLEQGPHKRSAVILDVQDHGDTAVLRVRQPEARTDGTPYTVTSRVTLVREGRYWRMKDIGGGRAAVEGRLRPEDRVVLDGPPPEDGAPSAPSSAPSDAPTGPRALARAQELIAEAGTAWDAGRFGEALAAAEQALAIYEANLEPTDPRLQEVRGMVAAARAQARPSP